MLFLLLLAVLYGAFVGQLLILASARLLWQLLTVPLPPDKPRQSNVRAAESANTRPAEPEGGQPQLHSSHFASQALAGRHAEEC